MELSDQLHTPINLVAGCLFVGGPSIVLNFGPGSPFTVLPNISAEWLALQFRFHDILVKSQLGRWEHYNEYEFRKRVEINVSNLFRSCSRICTDTTETCSTHEGNEQS